MTSALTKDKLAATVSNILLTAVNPQATDEAKKDAVAEGLTLVVEVLWNVQRIADNLEKIAKAQAVIAGIEYRR